LSTLEVGAFTTDPETLAAVTAAAAEDAEQVDRTASFPARTLERLHDLGVFEFIFRLGPERPTEDELTALIVATAKGDPTTALLLVNTIGSFARQKEKRTWPEDLYDEILTKVAAGPVTLNAARAEPELGAPARGGLPTTTARRTADGWAISGRKAYVTGSYFLDYHNVWAKTDEDPVRVGHFLVPGRSPDGTQAPGIEIVETWDHLGLRGSQTHDVIYDEVVVPEESFIEIPFIDGKYVDPVGRGGSGALLHIAIYVGVARAAQDFFNKFAKERVPAALGKPIAETERIQLVAGEIEAQLAQAEALLYWFPAQAKQDKAWLARSVLAKPLIARSAIAAVETAVAALGNPALSRTNPLERHLRDVLCARVHPPQDDAALRLAGRRALGLA
jgi:alkylation response protein AidB-like acyl-CoA dehydrogenase